MADLTFDHFSEVDGGVIAFDDRLFGRTNDGKIDLACFGQDGKM